MSKRYSGALITKTPVVPTSLSAPGVWSLSDQAAAQATNTWPFPRDPQFKNVTMLLHGDGSAGPVAATGVGAGVSTTVTNFNADASTNNFNVTINGDARSDNFTPYQAGYYSNYFAGTSGQYLNAPANAAFSFGTGDFTVEGWVYPTSTSGTRPIVEIRTTGGATGFAFLSQSGASTLNVYTNSAFVGASTNSLTLNAWSHVALVRSGNTWTYWINGVSSGSFTNTSTQSDGATTGPKIGGSTSAGEVWVGYLSNIRIIKGTAVYTSAFTPSTTPLTAISGTSLLTCQSNRFIDTSSNAFTITVNGSPSVSPAQPFTLPSSVATYGSGFFDGTGDYLTAPSNSAFAFGTGDFTVECWAYFTSVASFPTLTDSRVNTSSTAGFNLGLSTAKVQLYTTSQVLIGSTTLVANTWYHIAVTRSGTTLKIWLNGVQDATVSNSTNWSDTTLLIGSTPTPTNYMTGYMTDTRLVKGTAVYSATFTPPTAPLTAITNTSLLTTQYNGGGNNSGFKDSSQFNFPITRNGNTTQGTFTPYGSNWSNYFNGSSYFQIASTSVMNMNTYACLECWVNLSSSGANQLHVGRDSNYWIAYSFSGIGGSANKFVFSIYNGSAWSAVSSSTSPTVGTWYHVAGIRSGSTLQIYINGVLETTGTLSGTASTSATPIGIADNQGTSPMTGYLSNVRVNLGSTSAALPYTANFTPSTSPLTAVTGTQLLTCQSNRFVDNSASPLTLTVNGSPSVQRFSPFAPLTVYNPTTYGGSAYFDGTSANIITTNTITTIGTQDFCLEAWVYAFSTSDYACIIGNDTAGGGAGWFIEMGTARGIFIAGPEVSLGSAQYNRWFHVVFCRVSNTYAGFVNGVRQATGSLTTNYSTAVKIGINSYVVGTLNKGTTGYIADGRVTIGSSPYSPSSTTLTVPTAPLTAVSGTVYLASMTNAGILDNGMMNDLQTVGNAQISTSVKKYGTGSMYFDGSGDYLTTYDPSYKVSVGSGDFTFECWVYVNSLPATVTALYHLKNDAALATTVFILELTPSGAISLSTGAALIASGTNGKITTGSWIHFAFVRTSGVFKTFFNGVQDISTANTTAYNGTYLQIGAWRYSGYDFSLNGYIDDLRITKGVARYTTTFTVPDQAFPNG